jgi:hypothetical protein
VRFVIHKEVVMMPEYSYAAGDTDFQRLLSMGFTETEAMHLINMKDHVSEQVEYREMVEESRRLHFLRWLIEHDRLSK